MSSTTLSFEERKANIKEWYQSWLIHQLNLMHDELEGYDSYKDMRGLRSAKDQMLSMKHTLKHHINISDEDMISRITSGKFENRVDRTTTFLCSWEKIYDIVKEALLDEDNTYDIIDWMADAGDDQPWFLYCDNVIPSKGYAWNPTTRTCDEMHNLRDITIILKKKDNTYRLYSVYPSTYPT